MKPNWLEHLREEYQTHATVNYFVNGKQAQYRDLTEGELIELIKQLCAERLELLQTLMDARAELDYLGFGDD